MQLLRADRGAFSPSRLRRVLCILATAAVSLLSFNAVARAQTLTRYPRPFPGMPDHIVTGSDGALWFSTFPRPNVGRITTDGVIQEFPTGRDDALGISVGPDGQIWFPTLTGLARIAGDGIVTDVSIPAGSVPREMIRNVDGDLWYMDFTGSNTSVSRRAASGDTTTKFVTAGTVGHGTVVGPDGTFWISAYPNLLFRVKRSGEITTFTLPTPTEDAMDLAAGPDGSLWYAPTGTKAVGRITPAGQVQDYPLEADPTGAITRGADGYVWVATIGFLYRFDSVGSSTRYPLAFPGSVGIRHMIAGPDGNLWFTYSGDETGIARFQPPADLASLQYLSGARFETKVTWSSPGFGTDLPAPVIRITGDTGAVYFFSPGNVELILKVVDGTAVNGKRWVFVAALTDVAYTLTIRDLLTGAVQTYSRPQGQMVSFADTAAFGF